MKRNFIRTVAAILACIFMLGSTSCIGSFSLTNRLLGWNKTVGNKFLNELVFFAFWVLPVYEVTGFIDVVVLNSIEFWSGSNPMDVAADRTVTNSNGDEILIHTNADGYELTNLSTEETMKLCYDADINGWKADIAGESHVLFTFVDDTHIRVPLGSADQWTTVELSEHGILAYRAETLPSDLALR